MGSQGWHSRLIHFPSERRQADGQKNQRPLGLDGLTVLIGVVLTGSLWGQEFRGSILGRITDSTGASCPRSVSQHHQ